MYIIICVCMPTHLLKQIRGHTNAHTNTHTPTNPPTHPPTQSPNRLTAQPPNRPNAQLPPLNQRTVALPFDAVERGHQCMIFVHARNATVFTAQKMIEMANGRGDSDLFLPQNTTLPVYQNCKKKVNSSKNQQWKELFQGGFGMHHAGMLRGDRTMVERAFSDGHMRILGKSYEKHRKRRWVATDKFGI